MENQEKELTVGTRVEHDRYGEGFVCKNTLTSYDIIFERGGKMTFSKTNIFRDIKILDEVEDTSNESKLTLDEVESVLNTILQRYSGVQQVVDIANHWKGGTLVMKPGNDSQPKELPIETFFHKIVMLRDRLRVLEQNINSHKILDDQDKVNLQQYITRIYGSLTTFNVLFKDKKDYFVGVGGGKKDDDE
ncbi:MAG: hypothetical protein LBL90_05480 [Prevotellaceae bacterium]|jgi:hypothetical protein|nr:hypothetical protein [Prevotellaceae bacterium]